jgi:hypothetical protein
VLIEVVENSSPTSIKEADDSSAGQLREDLVDKAIAAQKTGAAQTVFEHCVTRNDALQYIITSNRAAHPRTYQA